MVFLVLILRFRLFPAFFAFQEVLFGLGLHAAAHGARGFDGLVPSGEVTVGVTGTAVEDLAALRALFNQITAALGALYLERMCERAGGFAFGVSRAGEEFAKAAFFDHHGRTAFVAFFIGELFLEFGFFFLVHLHGLGVLAFGEGGTT